MKSHRDVLEMILGHLGFVFEVEELTTPDGVVLQVHTRDPGRLIGMDGKTIEELQYLVNRIANQSEEETGRVTVDVEGYRQSLKDQLEQKVRKLAERVRQTGRPVTLDPMNSYDRRIVHNCIKDDPHVMTQSPPTQSRFKRITIRPRPPAQKPKASS